ncbi:MAG TPA: hypothetical protein DCW42_03430 [Bacteroidetes bacterium]|nr:hypothetical protein [Bacteroidota bacterium]
MKISLITYVPKISKNGTQEFHSIKYILDPFLKSLTQSSTENVEVEVINLDQMLINECLGCSEDLFFTPQDTCRQKDDMNSVYPILRDSDLWFFAISSNLPTLPTKLLNFLDRLEPLFTEDFLEMNGNGKSSSKKKFTGGIFLLGTSFLWDRSVFDELTFQMQSLAVLFNRELKGQILRPHYSAFIEHCENDSTFKEQILKDINYISNSILNSEKIDDSHFQSLNAPIITRDEYIRKFSEVLSII